MNNPGHNNFVIVLLQSMLRPSSEQAVRISKLFRYFNIAAIGMLLFITALTIYICFRFSKKSNQQIPKQTKGNNKLEALMIIIPALLLAFFFYQTVSVMHAVDPEPDHYPQADVIITGHQFWWEINYPSAKFTTANELHLPVGKKILLELRSADVIHDWWVPALGNKMDLVPGRVNHLWVTIQKPETLAGLCSEFCGAQHAWMRMDVIASNTTDYQQWLNENARVAKSPADSLSLRGAGVFQVNSCAGCHNINGTEAMGRTGPDLTHLFSRKKMLGGLLPVSEGDVYQWLKNPQRIKPGSKMPNFIFSQDTIKALAHYLAQLK